MCMLSNKYLSTLSLIHLVSLTGRVKIMQLWLLRYNRSCSVRILWQKLCQDILSVVVSDIKAVVGSRYYNNCRSKILQERKCHDITTVMVSSYYSICNISIIALKVSRHTRSGKVRYYISYSQDI